MPENYFAHTSSDGRTQILSDHLRNTAELAKQYASEFDAGNVAEQIGLLHDVGKHTDRFQKVLNGELTKIDHAMVGAIFYFAQKGSGSKFLKRTIAGIVAAHHSVLRCRASDMRMIEDYECFTPDSFKKIAVSSEAEFNSINDYIRDNALLMSIEESDYPDFKTMSIGEKEFYTRMLFSCLVDADYSETASFENPDYINKFEGEKLNPELLLNKLDEYREHIISTSDPKQKMNIIRNNVYRQCTEKGKEKIDRLYTLTAPTGTAKTLALFSFALQKAKEMNKKRIFIVLPYLSIISQNAQIYREICGHNIVLEDDSLTDYTEETRLYSDRWSSPIIVTTSVNFFETLFKAKPTSLRKLHQIANSVVVFDECQTLPSNVLNCTMEIMDSLTKNYHTTVLFSTATLPAYRYRKNIKWNPVEIIDDVKALYDDYAEAKRTHIEYDTVNEYDSEKLIIKMKGYDQVLYVFNTVKKAMDMYKKLLTKYDDTECFMLSSGLCSQHKLDVIDIIKKRLKEGRKCFVSATQCIEAGVDFDFPCGAREYSPYDSEVQTAGRVNRNGKNEGYILYFRHVDSKLRNYPSAYYRNASELSFKLSEKAGEYSQVEMMEEYFKRLYTTISACESDDLELTDAIKNQDYEKISEKYKLIEERDQVNIIVPYAGMIEKYNSLSQEIHEMGNCINKNLMREATMLKVSSYNKDEAERHCERLSLRNSKGTFQTNWYLMTEKNMYTKYGIDFEKGDVSICL